MRVGMGYDVHRLVEGRKLIIEELRFHMRKDSLDTAMRMYFFMR